MVLAMVKSASTTSSSGADNEVHIIIIPPVLSQKFEPLKQTIHEATFVAGNKATGSFVCAGHVHKLILQIACK